MLLASASDDGSVLLWDLAFAFDVMDALMQSMPQAVGHLAHLIAKLAGFTVPVKAPSDYLLAGKLVSQQAFGSHPSVLHSVFPLPLLSCSKKYIPTPSEPPARVPKRAKEILEQFLHD